MEYIHSDQAPAAIGPYSQAIKHGGLLFTSGQIALDVDGNLIEGDIGVQTDRVFLNLKAILEAGGATFQDVIKATVFLKNMEDFPTVNEKFAQYFGDHRPARSTVEVARLPKDVLVEIEFIARAQ